MTSFHMANSSINHCCFSPDGRLIAVAADRTLYVWDITVSDPCIVQTLIGHIDRITSLTFSSPSSLISSSEDQSIKFWQIGALPIDPVTADLKPIPLTSSPIKSITLQTEDGIAISNDLDGVVCIWDISTGLCKASFKTPAKDHSKSDVRLIESRLILIWQVGKNINIWNVEKEELLQTVYATWDDVDAVRISGDGSKVFSLSGPLFQAWSIWTGEVIVDQVWVWASQFQRSLVVGDLRVWVHSPSSDPVGWDFGTPSPPPAMLPKTPILYMKDTKLWDTSLSRIKDVATGKGFFHLGGRFAKPVDVQLDDWYLVARYESGEVLILDFNHMVLQ